MRNPAPKGLPKEVAARYLRLTRLSKGIHVVGVLDTGVTILSQQVRALNLIWALDASGTLATATKVAVVGIAGLTAAAALLELFGPEGRATIVLFETQSALCPQQRGCDTRYVHPHAYYWPRDGAHNPTADLPILSWRAGRASDVAEHLVRAWEDLPGRKQNVREIRPLRYLRINAETKEVEWVGDPVRYEKPSLFSAQRGDVAVGDSSKTSDVERFDLIVLTIGYGPESNHGVPYWRNDTCGQPDLEGPARSYLVSGSGDGGLTDLFRIRITDFRQDRILQQLAANNAAIAALRELEAKRYRPVFSRRQASDFFERCRKLATKLELTAAIKRRLRADTTVDLLIGDGATVADAIRTRSSFVNKCMAVILFAAGGFTPRFGRFETLDQTDREKYYKVVIRHGPKTDQHLANAFTDSKWVLARANAMRKLVRSAERRLGSAYDARLWEPGWPSVPAGHHKAGSKTAYGS